MTFRQTFLKIVYPILMLKEKLFPKHDSVLLNEKHIQPIQSFYELTAIANNGEEIHFDQFKGKKIMIVNSASNCGYTAQYDDLEKLYQQQKENLIILAFPANDFKNQEKLNDKEIASFCKINYGVTFPLIKKATVIKTINQHKVFQWLSDSNKNGWCDQQPVWNFSKYLINENGILTHFFAHTVSPLDKKVLQALQ